MTLFSHVKDFFRDCSGLVNMRKWHDEVTKIVQCMQYFYSANSLQIEFRTAEKRNLNSSRDITCDQVCMLPFFSLPVRRLSPYILLEKKV